MEEISISEEFARGHLTSSYLKKYLKLGSSWPLEYVLSISYIYLEIYLEKKYAMAP